MKKRATKFLVGSNIKLGLGKQFLTYPLKKVFIVLIIGVSISLNTKTSFAQSIVKAWDRAYAQSNLNCHTLTDAIRTSDGGYLLAGHYRNCNIIGLVPSDHNAYWVVKTSSTGTLQWQRSFGGGSTDQLTSVIQTSDGGYLLGGSSQSGISGDKTQGTQGSYDYWIIKISSTGTKIWDRRYGGGSADRLASIVQATDGGYLLAGYSSSSAGGNKTQNGFGGNDFWIVKISSTGSKLWDKSFGGSSADFLTSAIRTSDGGYLLGGYSLSGQSGEKSQQSRGGYDYWVVKVTSLGVKQWDKRFGGTAWDRLSSLSSTSDGGYLLGGRSASDGSWDKSLSSLGGEDYWIVKITSAGAKVWDRRYGGTSGDVLTSIARTSDGGFLLGGSTASGISGDITQSPRGNSDFWVIKITSAGIKQWNRRYGGSASDALSKAIALSNPLVGTTGFLLAGTSESSISGDRTQSLKSVSDFWIVRISIEQVIGGTTVNTTTKAEVNSEPINEMQPLTLQANPNPFTNKVLLSFTMTRTQQIDLEVYDTKGSRVVNLFSGKANAGQTYRIEFNGSTLPSGMYIARLRAATENGQVKLVLIR